MKIFEVSGGFHQRFRFKCDRVILVKDGDRFLHIPLNPILPPEFDDTPNGQRDPRSMSMWGLPYILTVTKHSFKKPFPNWLTYWPEGTRYDVRCLDGGAWDRSTVWGQFGTLVEAVACATR